MTVVTTGAQPANCCHPGEGTAQTQQRCDDRQHIDRRPIPVGEALYGLTLRPVIGADLLADPFGDVGVDIGNCRPRTLRGCDPDRAARQIFCIIEDFVDIAFENLGAISITVGNNTGQKPENLALESL